MLIAQFTGRRGLDVRGKVIEILCREVRIAPSGSHPLGAKLKIGGRAQELRRSDLFRNFVMLGCRLVANPLPEEGGALRIDSHWDLQTGSCA